MESSDFEQFEKDHFEKEKIKNIQEILESFKEYLSIILNTVNKGNYNKKMVDNLCIMINKYYKNLNSDLLSENNESSNEESDEDSDKSSDKESDEESDKSSDEESDKSSNEESDKESDKSSNDSSDKSTDKEEQYKPIKLKNISSEQQDMKEDIYFQTFINNSVDINKRVFPINHDISKKIKIYTQKVYLY